MNVHRIGAERIVDRTWYGAQGCLMRDELHPRHRAPHRLGIAQVPLDDLNVRSDGGQVRQTSGREVVQDANPFSLAHQGFDDVGADEAGAAGHQIHKHIPEPRRTVSAPIGCDDVTQCRCNVNNIIICHQGE